MDQISDIIRAPFVRIEPERDGEGWAVITFERTRLDTWQTLGVVARNVLARSAKGLA